MNKAILAIIPIIIVVGIVAYAISPYFTESSIDEALPAGTITQPIKDDTDEMMGKSTEPMMKDDDMMDDDMMKDDGMMKGDDSMMEEEMMKDDKMMDDDKMKDDGMMKDDMMMNDDDVMMDDKDMMKDDMMMDDDDMMKSEMVKGSDKMMDDDMMKGEDKMSDEDKMKDMMKDEDMIDEVTIDDEGMMMKEDERTKDEMKKDAETVSDEIIPTFYAGTFIGVNDGIHNAEGDAYTLSIDDGSTVLRLEDFKSTPGPDLYVYLATDKSASDFVNLGELKANRGNQNYEIPEDTDLDKYGNVLVWCKLAGVLFGSAEILPQV